MNADSAVQELLFAWSNPAFQEAFSFITMLGSTPVIIAIAAIGTLYLLRRGEWSLTIGLFASLLVSTAATFILKELVHRARPTEAVSTVIAHSYSFPSGHTTRAIALFGFFAYAAFRLATTTQVRTSIMITCISVVALVSFSRLYLGVHFLTDVLGGVLVGTMGVFTGARVSVALQPRNFSGGESI